MYWINYSTFFQKAKDFFSCWLLEVLLDRNANMTAYSESDIQVLQESEEGPSSVKVSAESSRRDLHLYAVRVADTCGFYVLFDGQARTSREEKCNHRRLLSLQVPENRSKKIYDLPGGLCRGLFLFC